MYTVVLRGSNTSTYPLCKSSLWERWFIHLPDLSYLCILACIMLFDLTLSPHIAPSLYSMYKLLCYLTLEVPCASFLYRLTQRRKRRPCISCLIRSLIIHEACRIIITVYQLETTLGTINLFKMPIQ